MTLKTTDSEMRAVTLPGQQIPLSMRSVARTMEINRVAFVGVIIVLVFFGGFMGWASIAPLDSAASASATIVVESSRKAIQHFDGGTVSEVLVHEGDKVTAGQPLVVMDTTNAKATVDMLQGELDASQALVARLTAERDRKDTIDFPPELMARGVDPKVQDVMTSQQRAFDAKHDAVESQTRILKQRNIQIDEEIKGLHGQIDAEDRQSALIKEEEKGVKTLVDQGLERRPRLLQLQREAADIDGKRAENYASISRAAQTAGENDLKIVDLTVSVVTDAAQKMHDEQVKIGDVSEKLRSASEVLDRTVIRAPVSGQVVNLKLFTPGGVVPPRDTVMEIVPDNDRLIAEAQVSPTDIDVVHKGLRVQLRLSAFNQRTTPTVFGKVETVSADKQTDQRTGNSYYTARIVIDEGLDKIKDLELYPGMPAEAMIITGQRTLMAYLTKPLFSSINRGLREQ
jgi:HlyD family type I secretion membrane fusion protein